MANLPITIYADPGSIVYLFEDTVSGTAALTQFTVSGYLTS